MTDVTESNKNSPSASSYALGALPGLLLIGLLAFLRHRADFDSQIVKLSLEASTAVFGFLGWLWTRKTIKFPQKIETNTFLFNLSGYSAFAAAWYISYLLLKNFLPGTVPPTDLLGLIQLLEKVFIAVMVLFLGLTCMEMGKQKRQVTVPQVTVPTVTVPKVNPNLIAGILIGSIIVIGILSFLFPQQSDKHREQAMHFIKIHDYQNAVTCLTQAIQESNDNSSPHIQYYADRAYAYEKLGKNKEAVDDLSCCIKDIQENQEANVIPFRAANYYVNRANDYMILGQYQNAIDDYSKVLGVDKKNGSVYYTRGTAYERLGKHDFAIKDQDKAKELGYAPALSVR